MSFIKIPLPIIVLCYLIELVKISHFLTMVVLRTALDVSCYNAFDRVSIIIHNDFFIDAIKCGFELV